MPNKTAPVSARYRGWYFDQANGLLEAFHGTTRIFGSSASAFTVDIASTFSNTVTFSNTATFNGTTDLSNSTVTLPTRTAFFDQMDALLGADGAALGITETAGDFYRALGTNQIFIKGEATVNETEVSVGYFRFVLPENYVAGGTITLRATTDVDVAGDAVLNAASTIDFEAYKQSTTDGSVGSDLVTTAATAVTATAADKDFTVTPTGLVAGDTLIVKMTTSIVEDAGGTGAATAFIYRLGVVCQVNK